MLGQRGGAIEINGTLNRDSECLARAKLRKEPPCRFVQSKDFNAGRPSLDQQMDRAVLEIDPAKGFVVGFENGVPDIVYRLSKPEQAERGVRNEANTALIVGLDRTEPADIERFSVWRMECAIHRPFQLRDIAEIGDRHCRRERAQELPQLSPVFIEACCP